MKKLVLAAALLLTFNLSNAQEAPVKKTAGTDLVDASTLLITGVSMQLGGALIIGGSSFAEDSEARIGVGVLGGIIMVGGLVTQIVGYAKIGSAGKLLGSKNVTLDTTPNGLSLAYKF